MNTTELMQARFWELKPQSAAITARGAARRAERDAIMAKIQKLEAEAAVIAADVREIEAPLLEINREMTRLTKALDGKVGEGPG